MSRIFFYLSITLMTTILWSCNNQSVDSSSTALEVSLNDLTTKNVNGKNIMYYKAELFTGNAVSKMKNGNPFTLNGYKDGIKHGHYATWYANGNKQQEGYYKNGVQDSINIEYYESGQKQREHHWVMGKKNGTWLSWYEDGAKWTHRDFRNDQNYAFRKKSIEL